MSVVKNLANFTIFSNPIGLVNRSHLYVYWLTDGVATAKRAYFFTSRLYIFHRWMCVDIR
ncbi:hypothetical protein RchiOBHm_Chr2g0128081 [Rosa chinensis]|uniref:Uncharacterized protein n=1 Tax=Rosa chinensis TaxID=74649 RepID=A0A2P6RU88_ROSCH|nr:hypothetical protein RchiOBHm_Chr2g0128081 [Rosa chinensis]